MPPFLSLLAILALLWLAFMAVRGSSRYSTTVYEWHHGLLYVDGRFARPLPPGRYWNAGFRNREIVTIPKTDQVHLEPNVDVTSADKFIFRLSAVATYRVTDPRLAHEEGHRERLRLAVSTAIGTLAAARTLDAILSDRAALDAGLTALLAAPVSGCEIQDARISAIGLPPEVRRLFTEVERAKLESAAALERARGEQAALRSLANAARMLKGNPELLNLRVLQALDAPGKNRPTLVLGQNGLLPSLPDDRAADTGRDEA